MKKDNICPKCQSNEIVYIETVRDNGGMSDFNSNFAIGTGGGFFSLKNGNGELEVYCCRDCGYTEFYVKNLMDLDPDRNSLVQKANRKEPSV